MTQHRTRPPAVPAARPANRYYSLDDRSIVAAVSNLAPRLSGTLLDLGAGDCRHQPLVRPFVRRYVPMDVDGYGCSGGAVGDGRALPFRNESLDSVLCTQVLEHVPEPWLVIREIARTLRPGGVGLITVPLNNGIHMAPQDYFRFTEFALRRMFFEAGLELVVLVERGGRVLTAAQAIMLVFEHDTMPRRSVVAAVARRIIRASLGFIDRVGPWIDRRFPRRGNPLGYAALVRKPGR